MNAWLFLSLVLCCEGVLERTNVNFHSGSLQQSRAQRNNLNETFFNTLESYQVNAVEVDESKYPWIARVVHSRTQAFPHVCTASCVDQRIFITAARCIYGLKIDYTTIFYKNDRIPALAFVFPSNSTKQAYDDLGFIVVKDSHEGPWETVQIVTKPRSGEGFEWFADWSLDARRSEFKAVGYATLKINHKANDPERTYNLTELDVFINIAMCAEILTFNFHINGFFVPCYHSCNLQEFKSQNSRCSNYHGVEGGAVYDVRTEELIGVATWGPYYSKFELPVGFSVPNSEQFYIDYECARHIRNDRQKIVAPGYYQKLCE